MLVRPDAAITLLDEADAKADRAGQLSRAFALIRRDQISEAQTPALEAFRIEKSNDFATYHYLFGFEVANRLLESGFDDESIRFARGWFAAYLSDPKLAVDDLTQVSDDRKWKVLPELHARLGKFDLQIDA